MNNFHFIDVKPSIDRSEVASIKDAIFKRAREKSNALANEKSESYTSQMQNDVMEIARIDFQETAMNPFNQFKESLGLNQPAPEPIAQQPTTNEPKLEEIFTKELKRNIESVSNQTFTQSVKDETMTAARNQFRQQTNLMATLNFLNTQAAIQMAKNAHSKINFSA